MKCRRCEVEVDVKVSCTDVLCNDCCKRIKVGNRPPCAKDVKPRWARMALSNPPTNVEMETARQWAEYDEANAEHNAVLSLWQTVGETR